MPSKYKYEIREPLTLPHPHPNKHECVYPCHQVNNFVNITVNMQYYKHPTMSCKHNVNKLQVEIANLVKYVKFHEINKNNVRKLLKSHSKPSSKDSVTK